MKTFVGTHINCESMLTE